MNYFCHHCSFRLPQPANDTAIRFFVPAIRQLKFILKHIKTMEARQTRSTSNMASREPRPGDEQNHDDMFSIPQNQPCTPAPTRSQQYSSVLPTPPSTGQSQRPRLRHSLRIAARRQRVQEEETTESTRVTSPSPVLAPEQLPRAPSPPLHRQYPPQTPRISREDSPDVTPLPQNQQFCSCCPRPSGQINASTGEAASEDTSREATTTVARCIAHQSPARGSSDSQDSQTGSQTESHSGESDSLSKMDRQRKFTSVLIVVRM